jgi:voltage-gated potassium channel
VLPSILMFAHIWAAGSGFLALRAVRGMRMLRLLRLLRLVRLLKFIRYGYLLFRGLVNARIWASSVVYHYRLGRLGRLLVGVVVAWIVGANLVYGTECLACDEAADSPYGANYWRSYWNIIVVLISGMDTQAPVSVAGRIEVALLLVAGICVVGMLTGEIVSILVRSAQRSGKMALKPPGLRLDQHIVILGRNEHLQNIIVQVHAALGGQHYILVVCPDADQLPSTGRKTHHRVFGLADDPSRREALEFANLGHALRVIVLSEHPGEQSARDRDNVALMHALAAVARNRTVPLVVELQEPESLRYAAAIDNAECLVSRHFGERLISQAVLNPGVTEVYHRLMTFTGDSNEFYSVEVPPALLGKTFEEAQEHFLDDDDEAVVLVGLDDSAVSVPYERFVLGVDNGSDEPDLGDHVLDATDRLIVVAYQRPQFATVDEEDLWKGNVLARS